MGADMTEQEQIELVKELIEKYVRNEITSDELCQELVKLGWLYPRNS